jgi:hypothetical protein
MANLREKGNKQEKYANAREAPHNIAKMEAEN